MKDVDFLQYELMVILPPDLADQQLKTRLNDIRTAIKEEGGKIIQEDIAGIRDMAYRIGKFERGYYVVFHFEHDPAKVPTVEKTVRIETGVIRHLLIKTPKDYSLKTLKAYDDEAESARLKAEQERATDASERRKPTRRPMKEKPETNEELPVPAVKAEKPLSESEMQAKLKAEEKKLDSLLDNPDIQL